MADDGSITAPEQGTLVGGVIAEPSAQMSAAADMATGKSVDSEWEAFFSFHTSVNWSTSETQGKILFKQALGPLLNPYLTHLAKLYVAWSGSIDVRFSISGSGVFGGKLAAIVVPPGVDPVQSTSMLQYPHVLFDARQVEPVVFTIPDLRSTLYHLMSDTDTTSLVIMIYNDLINPYANDANSSGCIVTVETKPGSDFKFHLLKPPGSMLTHGSVPSDLIPKSSSLWIGNRYWTDITDFVIRPFVFQANRHFDFNQETAGWSTPRFRPITVTISQKGGEKLGIGIATDFIVPGIPDGWPDTTIPSKLTPAGDYAVTTSNGTDITTPREYDSANEIVNNTNFKSMYICGALQRAWGDKKISNTAFITTATVEGNNLEPSNVINPTKIAVFQDNHVNRDVQTSDVTLALLGYTGIGEEAIGADRDKVVRISVLPETGARGGNHPIFYKNTVKLGYVIRSIDVFNSQILHTSRQLSLNNYLLPPDSFAVYRIIDANGSWFDIGIDSDGFSFVGVSNIGKLEFPLSASYMGIQLAKIRLASNIRSTMTKL
uniref:Capsid protein VP1 n=2 Tax=Feline calicivirus TaxID=11978 RepID=A0A0J9X1Z3_FCV|nr:Chain A, VP1 [Feline calicivirus]4PB6_B Chain B, VP1 [Feline calicivirus]4PB6_C Chain C, VP1 [Feline calicivirus]4PB6_D Chain D, VP1 [Feline calicivirus]4PB6_E Chain E, VP1 [Feline calicivirus]4PB6_F Chain F, VP1 [Feline calicivirus]4PB6_G Chain G, VP1 [Feline calicivirus]4PB6_H Chain H, VP1 [Feline calicivirus]4PB6_I Chain I, VP1 [Feline calicivirus]4PB6_J Chain J, VP1 [Feline calicivirus]4PB6_K Chain K, VP1 [Feline calicivirus]4PB6_L Chain L, VP1 [Feline calicivirus]4PB6_M Chain M,